MDCVTVTLSHSVLQIHMIVYSFVCWRNFRLFFIYGYWGWIKLLFTFLYIPFCGQKLSFLLSKYLKVKLLHYRGLYCLHWFAFQLQDMRVLIVPHLCQHLYSLYSLSEETMQYHILHPVTQHSLTLPVNTERQWPYSTSKYSETMALFWQQIQGDNGLTPAFMDEMEWKRIFSSMSVIK